MKSLIFFTHVCTLLHTYSTMIQEYYLCVSYEPKYQNQSSIKNSTGVQRKISQSLQENTWIFLGVLKIFKKIVFTEHFRTTASAPTSATLKPGPEYWTLTQKKMDPKKPRPWKIWTMKNVRSSWTQKKDWKTTLYNLVTLKIC